MSYYLSRIHCHLSVQNVSLVQLEEEEIYIRAFCEDFAKLMQIKYLSKTGADYTEAKLVQISSMNFLPLINFFCT